MSTSTLLSLWLDYGNYIRPINSNRALRIGSGSSTAPSYTFINDSSTGMYLGAIGTLSFATSSGVRMSMSSTAISVGLPIWAFDTISLSLAGRAADSASAIGVILDNKTTLTTSGAKLVSIRNNTVEKAYIDKNGGFVTLGGMIQGRKGTDIASANNATLTTDGNYFNVTGNTQINTLSATGVQAGTMITLQFNSNPVVKHNTSGTGAPFYLSGGVDYNPSAGNTLTLVYDGTYWREISRS